jgi:hypothetical protein
MGGKGGDRLRTNMGHGDWYCLKEFQKSKHLTSWPFDAGILY